MSVARIPLRPAGEVFQAPRFRVTRSARLARVRMEMFQVLFVDPIEVQFDYILTG